MEAGASGYLLKDTPLATLLDAIRAAVRGETSSPAAGRGKLMSRMRAPAVEALTPRETEILAAVARGMTSAEIGRALLSGEVTAKTHLLRVFAKLGVDDRTRSGTVATKRGIPASPRL